MTLRRKIVALTLSLLLLFAMTAAGSVLLQSKISEQFSGVVDDYLPLNAAVATIDVFTDRYELDLRRLLADLGDAGAGAKALAQQGEAERVAEAGVLTATFQKAQAQLDQVVQDPRGHRQLVSAAQPDVNDWQWALEIYWQPVLQISVRRRVGWCEFSALLLSPLCWRCSMAGMTSLFAAP